MSRRAFRPTEILRLQPSLRMTRGGGFLQLLQGGDVELAGTGGLHAGYEGLGGGQGGGVGDAVADGGAAQQGQAAASV